MTRTSKHTPSQLQIRDTMTKSSAAIQTVTHTHSGASIRIHPYGATLLSFSSSQDGRNHLFVSENAIVDGSKPIRGGVPLVFPIFGPPSASSASTMPQHGFARRNMWTFVSSFDTDASAGCTYELTLKDVQDGIGEGNPWAMSLYDCSLQLTVDFCATRLTTTLTVTNTGTTAFPFQALLHTYYKIHGNAALKADQCYVTGLQGYTITDKVDTQSAGQVADATPLTIASEVDRVYTPPPTIHVACVTIGVGEGTVHMNASGQVNGKSVPVSCVVWNPHKAKAAAMSDFGNDEYHDMICVEPGILGEDIVLEAGKEAMLQQVVLVENNVG